MTVVVNTNILDALEIRSVYLRSCSVSLDDRFEPFLAGIELEVQLRHQTVSHRIMALEMHDSKDARPGEVIAFDVDVASRFLFKNPNQVMKQIGASAPEIQPSAKVVAATIEAKYSTVYDIRDGAKPNEAQLAEFGKSGPLFHVWPFWRELLHSTCGRIGIVPVVLPMLVGKPQSEMVKEGKDSKAGPAQRSAKRAAPPKAASRSTKKS